MCNMSLQPAGFSNNVEPLSFSTFHLLRTCNRLMLPNADDQSYYNIMKDSNNMLLSNIADQPATNDYSSTTCMSTSSTSKSPILEVMDTTIPMSDAIEPLDGVSKSHNFESVAHGKKPTSENGAPALNNGATAYRGSTALPLALPPLGMLPLGGSGVLSSSNKPPLLPSFEYIAPANHALNIADFPLMELNRVGMFPAFLQRRSRGEKRPIPDEQKDEKYYERRKRNNEAAKKSRDARKIREDRIAFRAALLEQENSILRAQVMALRDELHTMRQLISTATTTSTAATGLNGRNQR